MAAAALVHDPVFRVPEAGRTQSDPPLPVILHDLRQPLSSIQAIAYYLEMTVPAHQVEARAMMRKLQDMVQEAGSLLERAERRAMERR